MCEACEFNLKKNQERKTEKREMFGLILLLCTAHTHTHMVARALPVIDMYKNILKNQEKNTNATSQQTLLLLQIALGRDIANKSL